MQAAGGGMLGSRFHVVQSCHCPVHYSAASHCSAYNHPPNKAIFIHCLPSKAHGACDKLMSLELISDGCYKIENIQMLPVENMYIVGRSFILVMVL